MEIKSDLDDNKNLNICSYKLNNEKKINDIQYKTQLLNIDSKYRDIIPKNIYKSNNDILLNNPIKVTRNSNIIQINYPNHNFNIGDSIIIQNEITNYKISNNCIYFLNQFQYMIINYKNNNIPIDYDNYYSEYLLSIDIIKNINNSISYKNIPINLISGIFQIELPSIVDKITPLLPQILTLFNVSSALELDNDYLFIKLPYLFIISENYYYLPSDIFKLSFLNIGGIPLKFINADFPVDYNKNQGYQEIINIDNDNIYFQVPIFASSTIESGGNNVQVMLIIKTIPGYPDCNSYTINLKKSFNNVVRIELVSTEFPYIDFLIKSSGSNINNKLYWKHLDDGDYIYQISIPEGNYDSSNLISTINKELNLVPRFFSTPENLQYNIFNVSMNSYTQEITFIPYKNNNLPNSLSAEIDEINNIKYIKLTIRHPGNLVELNDTIQISGAIKIGSILDAVYINIIHTVYEVNITNQTYSVLIAPLNQITNATIIDLTGNGGPSTVIKTKAKVSFLFDKNDTLGNILGFKNVGQVNAVTLYKTIISNFDQYIISTNLNVVGNIDINTRILNLTGSNFYFLMYINDYECIINNSNQPTAFAKILLSSNPGDFLFNTFVNYPLEFDFPILTLNELNIKFIYPDGKLVDFRNIDHSFTLRIIEKVVKPYNTGINSKDTSFYETIIENN